jgi:23S rRNA pseudouridine1911/1915/1917 synthase
MRLNFSLTVANDSSAARVDKLFEIIHEDAELLVINKPADLVCHPTKGDAYSSLISRVRLHLGSEQTPRMVNRLDRETSGITLVAKSAETAGELGRIWETRSVEKEYLAIVHGHVAADCGCIAAPLGKDAHSRVAIKDCVRSDGAEASTGFVVSKRFERGGNQFTVLRVMPRTGRKHQIRIHLAHAGHPIVGDKLYGADEDLYLALVEGRLTEAMRERLILQNHALHAGRVTFDWRGVTREFVCEPETAFRQFCDESGR